jgi:hypothetical protein
VAGIHAAEFEQSERPEVMASKVFNRPDFAFVQTQVLVFARLLSENQATAFPLYRWLMKRGRQRS